MLKIIIALICVGFAAAGAVAFEIYRYADAPISDTRVVKTVTIPAGRPFDTAIDILSGQNLVDHRFKFSLVARIKGYDRRIKAGEYRLSTSMSPLQILEKMVRGEVVLHRLTIPEGYDLVRIAAAVESGGWSDSKAFLSAARDEAFVRRFGFEAASFEGYLFPETYYFSSDADAGEIITAMAERFKSVFKPEWKTAAEQKGFSVHEIVTLASIIEKETGIDAERPLVSSVFHNRLKRGMRLQSDPSVIYGIHEFDGNITRKHLTTRTPYNTYMITGLPPGPIANPGIKSIEAALFPADTDYLFFVARKDATHVFSTNLRDHNRAVQKYQLGR
ncbi:MAG: endolytic transglycosylase MltG [Desulfobacterales bacterium]